MDTGWADADWNAECTDDEHAERLEEWAPRCPIGNPQRVGSCLAYREREPGRLQLRVALRPRTEGICQAIVHEDQHRVLVRVLVCSEDCEHEPDDREYWDCPVHVYLEQPLNGRAVIDADSEEPLPLYVPS